MKFLILSLYPQMFSNVFSESIIARAQEKGLVDIQVKNIRDFAEGKRKNVDDVPFGGGAGMLMTAPPLFKAIEWAKKKMGKKSKVIFFTPQGKKFTQRKAEELAKNKEDLILLAGHFEGIDERVRQELVDEEISLGDFVLTGGEIPAMAVIDATTRLLPGVVGNTESVHEESFSEELFYQKEFPQYTRPAEFQGLKVPEVLLSGHHAEIKKWQMKNLRGLSERERKVLDWRLNSFPRKTKRTVLRLITMEDSAIKRRWLNDTEVSQYLTAKTPISLQDAQAYNRQAIANLNGIHLMIEDKKNKKAIGNIRLSVSDDNPFALNLGFLIGEKDFWNKGIATEVMREILNFTFREADFVKIYLNVLVGNKVAYRVYQKLGFQEVGESRQMFYKGGKFYSSTRMEILREDFLKK